MGQNVSDEELRVVDDLGGAELGDSRLPDEVQLALSDIASAAREGLLALSVTAGLAVLGEMMEAERTALCGLLNAKDPGRVLLCGTGRHRPRWCWGAARSRSGGHGRMQRMGRVSRRWSRSRRRRRPIC